MNSWVEYELNDVVNLKSGSTVSKDLERSSGDVAYIKVAGMNLEGNEERITTANSFLNLENVNVKNVLPIGSTIFPKRGGAIATNKKRITDIPLCIDLNTMAAIPDRALVLPMFIYYYFKTFDLLTISSGTTILQINNYSFNGLKIFVPLIPEQQRIIAILDQVFADIEQARVKAEQNLKSALELFESYLQQAFGKGWENKKISEIADTCLGKMLDKKKNKGSLKPYLRNLNVQWFDISTDDLLEMRFEDSEYERYAIKKGDLVLCEGGYPGRGAIWNKDEDIFFQKALHRIRCHNVIYNRWVLYYLFLSDCDGSLKNHFTGAGIQHFTGKALKQLSLPIPPEGVAKQYLEKIDGLHSEVRLLEAVYEKKLYQLDELKKSILQKAFSGELTKDSKGVAA